MQAEERVAFASRRGNRLVGVVHTAAGEGAAGSPAGVILCHGMESTKDGAKQRLLGERLSRAGMSVLRFDFSYVGESEGEFADLTFRGEVDDLVGAWNFFGTRVGGPIGLLGSSMGGAVALLFAAEEPRVRALATIAARLVRNNKPAPDMMARLSPLPTPKPSVQRGGINATAIATPGRAVTPPPPPPLHTTIDPASPEKRAIHRSSRFG